MGWEGVLVASETHILDLGTSESLCPGPPDNLELDEGPPGKDRGQIFLGPYLLWAGLTQDP